MKKLLFYLLFAFCALNAVAQVNANDLIIQGTVTDANTNSPVGGWPVTITGMGMTETVFTNSNGVYTDTVFGGSEIGPNLVFTIQTINCDSSTLIQTVSNNQGTVNLATADFQILCSNNSSCSAPIYMTIMNGNMYRFYTDTLPGIQSYAWYVTTFQADTATSSASFSATPSAYFAGSTFNSPDYVEACLTLTFSDGCTASSCDTFIYCDAGFTYTLDNQYGLTLTPDFPAGYMNELHYWTLSGPGIPNPTQNTEIAIYYVEPGATYNVCQQLMITASGCNTNECQVITIPDTTVPVCDAAFTYYYQPTNAYLNVSSPYTYGQGSFEHNWLVTSYMSDGTVNTNNQLNVNNNSLFVAANTSALEICHTLTNLNTGCVDSSCQYIDFCTAEYTHVIDTANQVLTLTAGGVQTLASHSWNVTYHAIGGVYDSEILNGPIATFLLPEGILDMTICHMVNNTFPGSTCSAYACDTIVFCNAEFTVIDNGNGTAGIWAVSPPIDGAVYTWSITGPGYSGTAYSGSYFNFTPVPNEPYYVCMAYFNAETGCVANNCDTVVVEGISDSCSAAFTYTYINNIVYAVASTPYISGNEYSWTVQSSVYGTIANTGSSGPQATFTLPQNPGIVTMCMNLTNAFNGCNESFCDTLELPTDTTCTADIVLGYAPDGWPMFSANASSEIATYTWILTPYDNNGQAVGSGFYSTQSNAYIPSGTSAYAYIEACLSLTFTSGCTWSDCATFTAQPDTGNTLPCNAVFTFTGPLPIDNSYQFIGVPNDASANHYWSFGDGTSSTLESPFHAFETTGTYTVCHTVDIEGICSDSTCFTANFIGNSTTGLFIAGEVNAGANVPDNGKVKLYSLDTLSNSVVLLEEFILSNSGDYIFSGLQAGTYLIKAGLVQGSAWYGDYVPTYFGSQFYWFDAEPVYLTQSGDNYDISLIYAGNGGGPGSVSGSIDDGPYRLMDPESAGVESANPVAGADVVVTNLSGNPQRWIDADNSGNYAISNLDYGTYRLMADEPGMLCVPIEFTISPDFPSIFIDIVMGEELTGIETNSQVLAVGDVYPNPSQNNTFLNLNSSAAEELTIEVIGLDGKTVFQSTQRIAGNSVVEIPSSTFAPGMYFLRLTAKENGIAVNRKLQIVR